MSPLRDQHAERDDRARHARRRAAITPSETPRLTNAPRQRTLYSMRVERPEK